MVKEGDEFPSVTLALRGNDLDLKEVLKKGPVVLLGAVGAFEKRASLKLLPGYRDIADDLKGIFGISFIGCVIVNDPYVVKAWARRLRIQNEITMISDVNCLLTKTLNMDVDMSTSGFGSVVPRCQMFSMLIKDYRIQWIGYDQEAYALSLVEAAARVLDIEAPSSLLEKCMLKTKPARLNSKSKSASLVTSGVLTRFESSKGALTDPLALKLSMATPDSCQTRLIFRYAPGSMTGDGYNFEFLGDSSLKITCWEGDGAWGSIEVDLVPLIDRKTFNIRKRSESRRRKEFESMNIPGNHPMMQDQSEDEDDLDDLDANGNTNGYPILMSLANDGPSQPQNSCSPPSVLCTYEVSSLILNAQSFYSYGEAEEGDKLELQIVHRKAKENNDLTNPSIRDAPAHLIVSQPLASGGRDILLAGLIPALQSALENSSEPGDNPSSSSSQSRYSVSLDCVGKKGLDISHYAYEECQYFHFQYPFRDKSDATAEFANSLWYVPCNPCFAARSQIDSLRELLLRVRPASSEPTGGGGGDSAAPNLLNHEMQKSKNEIRSGALWRVCCSAVQ